MYVFGFVVYVCFGVVWILFDVVFVVGVEGEVVEVVVLDWCEGGVVG